MSTFFLRKDHLYKRIEQEIQSRQAIVCEMADEEGNASKIAVVKAQIQLLKTILKANA